MAIKNPYKPTFNYCGGTALAAFATNITRVLSDSL